MFKQWSAMKKTCELILGSMRETYERHQILTGSEPNLRVAWGRAHLKTAQPGSVMTGLMRAGIVIGPEIRTAKDKKLGEIQDVVLDPVEQNIAYVLASRGGLLDIGEELVAVRWKDLRVAGDHELYLLNTPKSVFNKALTIDRRNFEETADSDWRRELDQFWEQNLEL